MNHFVNLVLRHIQTERGSIEQSQIVADLEHLRDFAGVKDLPKNLAHEVDDAVAELLALGRLRWEGGAVVWVRESVEVVQATMF